MPWRSCTYVTVRYGAPAVQSQQGPSTLHHCYDNQMERYHAGIVVRKQNRIKFDYWIVTSRVKVLFSYADILWQFLES